MTAVLVEKAMLETFIGEKSIVGKSVHIFQTLGKVVRTVQHAWKSSPHFFNVFFNAFFNGKMYYLRIGFHPFKNDGMESAEKKVRIFLGTAPKLFDTSLLFYLPDFRETTPGNWLPCGVFWVFWHSEISASDTFKRIQKNASPKLTRNDE